jgi:hypothetical protein
MFGLRDRSRRVVVPSFLWVALAVGTATLSAASAASAASASSVGVGFDISFPQCNGAFPSGGAFGIVGVNGGRPFGANPCLGTGNGPSELGWAGTGAQLYANTADPGPALSSHWPNGQVLPKPCNTPSNPGSDTPECHYDYGWNAAADSYQDAVTAYISLGWAAVGATRTPVSNQWWLDVESANSWTQTVSSNVQALQGEVDYLRSVGAAAVGFYSSLGDWQTLTGNTSLFGSSPSWLAGAGSLADAQSRCGGSGFTGGGVALVQFVAGGIDNDVSCAEQAALVFASGAQTLTAGVSSEAISIQLPEPSGAAVTVVFSSSSAAGSFSTNPSGPWSTSLVVQVATGASASPAVYYTDTRAGSPMLTATTPGYTTATQTETVSPAALATVKVSPANVQLRLGQSQALTATGADRYGNPVKIAPKWSVSPTLGTFTPNPANLTSFNATTTGKGMIAATQNGTVGTAAVSVASKHRQQTIHVSTRPSLHIRPAHVAPGQRVSVSGNAGNCKQGSTVRLISPAFASKRTAPTGTITTHVNAHGTFAATGRIPKTTSPGTYTITARCAGNSLGISATIQVS